MTTLRIVVSDEDIEHGIAGDCYACPVALAIKRATGRSEGITVGDDDILVGPWVFDTPEDVRDFIAEFDDERDVRPFAFDLEIPDDGEPIETIGKECRAES